MICINQAIKVGVSVALLVIAPSVYGYEPEIKVISLPLATDITRADIYYIEPEYRPVACLVMCPGINGSGRYYLEQPLLRRYAEEHQLELLGLSFSSDVGTLMQKRGYYCASQGAGELLLKAVDEHISNGIPLLLYGFSGGAHFVSSFQEFCPQRVLAWCAYTAGFWETPKANTFTPPGIVACGKLDDERYAPSFEYFQEGRKLGKPWCWVSLAETNHAECDSLNRFVQAYFASILDRNSKSEAGCWYDINTKQKVDVDEIKQLENVAWLPNDRISDLWTILHKP
jgi:hypothetical protein